MCNEHWRYQGGPVPPPPSIQICSRFFRGSFKNTVIKKIPCVSPPPFIRAWPRYCNEAIYEEFFFINWYFHEFCLTFGSTITGNTLCLSSKISYSHFSFYCVRQNFILMTPYFFLRFLFNYSFNTWFQNTWRRLNIKSEFGNTYTIKINCLIFCVKLKFNQTAICQCMRW